jgi:hypothetical protein
VKNEERERSREAVSIVGGQRVGTGGQQAVSSAVTQPVVEEQRVAVRSGMVAPNESTPLREVASPFLTSEQQRVARLAQLQTINLLAQPGTTTGATGAATSSEMTASTGIAAGVEPMREATPEAVPVYVLSHAGQSRPSFQVVGDAGATTPGVGRSHPSTVPFTVPQRTEDDYRPLLGSTRDRASVERPLSTGRDRPVVLDDFNGLTFPPLPDGEREIAWRDQWRANAA